MPAHEEILFLATMQSPKSCSCSGACGNPRTLPIATYYTGGNSCFKKEGDTPESKCWSTSQNIHSPDKCILSFITILFISVMFLTSLKSLQKEAVSPQVGKDFHCFRGNT